MTMDKKKTDAVALLHDEKRYCESFVTIRTKTGQLETLHFNRAQQALWEIIQRQRKEGKPVRIVILKARQLGMSTAIEALFFARTATRPNIRTAIIAHDAEATAHLFRMNKLFFDNLPSAIKPMRKNSNAQEIVFENPTADPAQKERSPGLRSSIRCLTAGGSAVGRGDTLTLVHASEAAFWARMDETLDGLLQAVPDDPDTAVVIETTPNGYNAFKQFWDDAVEGKNGFLPVFFPWYTDANYRRKVPPKTTWTAEELELQRRYGLDDEQMQWRRWCIATNLRGDAEKFKQEYPSTPHEAFLTSGTPFFSVETVLARLEVTPQPIRRGRYVYGEGDSLRPTNWQWQDDAQGEIQIFEDAAERTPYVMGGDTAGDGSDRFTGFLLNNLTGKQAAALCYSGGSEIYYAQQLYCLGMEYGGALAAVEINFSTYPQRKLEEWDYPLLYIREKTDDASRALNEKRLGWRTDARTRPLALANLQTVVAENAELFADAELLREMLTFQRNRDMRPEAAEGQHDDRVMAAAIAHAVRGQQSYTVREITPERVPKLTERMKHARRIG